MKVYLLLACQDDKTHIQDVYASEEGANVGLKRLCRNDLKGLDNTKPATLHIIKRGVKGLAGIKFEIDGKKRFLTGSIKEVH